MSLAAKLTATILTLTSFEAPNQSADKLSAYERDALELAVVDEQVVDGSLVSPTVDLSIIASIEWFESRFRLHSPDGDCHEVGLLHSTRTCDAVGPMQVNKAAAWPLRLELPGLTAQALRDPLTNVRAGYATLKIWKRLCGGDPGVWLTAYGWGRCPRRPDWEGARRCALAQAISRRLGADPWTCDGTKRSVDVHTRRLVARLGRST